MKTNPDSTVSLGDTFAPNTTPEVSSTQPPATTAPAPTSQEPTRLKTLISKMTSTFKPKEAPAAVSATTATTTPAETQQGDSANQTIAAKVSNFFRTASSANLATILNPGKPADQTKKDEPILEEGPAAPGDAAPQAQDTTAATVVEPLSLQGPNTLEPTLVADPILTKAPESTPPPAAPLMATSATSNAAVMKDKPVDTIPPKTTSTVSSVVEGGCIVNADNKAPDAPAPLVKIANTNSQVSSAKGSDDENAFNPTTMQRLEDNATGKDQIKIVTPTPKGLGGYEISAIVGASLFGLGAITVAAVCLLVPGALPALAAIAVLGYSAAGFTAVAGAQIAILAGVAGAALGVASFGLGSIITAVKNAFFSAVDNEPSFVLADESKSNAVSATVMSTLKTEPVVKPTVKTEVTPTPKSPAHKDATPSKLGMLSKSNAPEIVQVRPTVSAAI